MGFIDATKKINQAIRDGADSVDTLFSRYWPENRTQAFGAEDSFFKHDLPGTIPPGIVTWKRVLQLAEIEWAQLLAALIEAEIDHLERVKLLVQQQGVFALYRIVGYLAGEKTKYAADVLKWIRYRETVDYWRDMEIDFRSRCAEARQWLIEHQLGRTKEQQPKPGSGKTNTRFVYSRHPPEELRAAVKKAQSPGRKR